MIRNQRELLREGFDEALNDHIRKLVNVLMTAALTDRQAAIKRFKLGLDNALDIHQQLQSILDGQTDA